MRIPRLAFNGILYQWNLVIPEHWSERTKFVAHFVERLLPIYSISSNFLPGFHHLWFPFLNNIIVLNSTESIAKKFWIIGRCAAEWGSILLSFKFSPKYPIENCRIIHSLMNIGENVVGMKGQPIPKIIDKTLSIFCNAAYAKGEALENRPNYRYMLTILVCQEAFQCGLKVFKLYQWHQGVFQPGNRSELFFMFFDPCCKAILCFARLSQALHAWDEFKKDNVPDEEMNALLKSYERVLNS